MSSNSKVEIFTDLGVDDKNIELGDKYNPTDSGADGGGITLRGTTEKTFNWVQSTNAWTSSEHLELSTGKSFRINGVEVLSSTALGSGISISGASVSGQLSNVTSIINIDSITGAGNLDLYAGGVNKNITLTPSGTGRTIVDGLLSHDGLYFSIGTEIDQLKIYTKSLLLTTEWTDTGISGTDLATGSYIVQLFANDAGGGGTNNNEYYSGVMSWYNQATSSSLEMPTDEIQMHRAGASGDGSLYLRTYRTNSGLLKLQIYSNTANNSSSNYVFKFRRVL